MTYISPNLMSSPAWLESQSECHAKREHGRPTYTVNPPRFDNRRDNPPITRPPIVSASELLEMEFEPVKYVVPGYVSEGLTIVAGRPKLGKSWLVLEWSMAVARSSTCLGGIQCEGGDVLYLALEDNRRRLQSRLDRILPAGAEGPPNLHFATEWPRASEGGLQLLKGWLDEHPAARLIVIDVLTCFRDADNGKVAPYERDYLAMRGLQSLAMEYGVAVVVVHHTRKSSGDGGDQFERISGTLGLSGAADSALVLDRDGNGCTLYGRGRDIQEIETAVRFDKDLCRWFVLGEASEVRRTDERSEILAVLKEADEPMSPADLSAATGMVSLNLRQLLYKMGKAGEVMKAGRGRYIHPDRTDLADNIKGGDNNDNKVTNSDDGREEWR